MEIWGWNKNEIGNPPSQARWVPVVPPPFSILGQHTHVVQLIFSYNLSVNLDSKNMVSAE
jgi:hypothetical protein